MPSFSNHLIHETSPYLLQHAHNPVNWYPWGDEALTRAREENKPILVSIGYAACHWCHVMERESFENESTAAYMNQHFINIKIDREERPDLDHIYMDAVQAITGGGGWPLNVFLTPEGKPFYGGTYFPPVKAFNRASWMDVLEGVEQAFREKREEMNAQAENLTAHLISASNFGVKKVDDKNVFTVENTVEVARNILKNADKEWGGFGKAPKFPQTFSIQYLLRFFHVQSKRKDHETLASEGLKQALLSLDKMIDGGIYDQVGGGFARYSTDTEWLAPHFEKMLYDNALLISVISEAYQLTKKERYREVIIETMEFLKRELLYPLNTSLKERKAFYSALDADSEGVEGKFYVWDQGEVNSLLGSDAAIFNAYYDISSKGNWSAEHNEERTNILRVNKRVEDFVAQNNMDIHEIKAILEKGKNKLLEKRAERIRPLLDDKIILGWNALMNTALCQAFAATGLEEYRSLAIQNMEFVLEKFTKGRGEDFYHTWKNEEAKYPAFLDDYAFLVQALLHLQEITADRKWLSRAVDITGFILEHFSEEDGIYFYFTRDAQKDVIIRKREIYDGALPSGNAVMAKSLYHLSILTDKPAWRERSALMVSSLGGAILKYPGSFGVWAALLQEMVAGTNEIAVTGQGYEEKLDQVLGLYLPHRVIMCSEKEENLWPLLAGKQPGMGTSIWLCRNYTCQQPVFSVEELTTLIARA